VRDGNSSILYPLEMVSTESNLAVSYVSITIYIHIMMEIIATIDITTLIILIGMGQLEGDSLEATLIFNPRQIPSLKLGCHYKKFKNLQPLTPVTCQYIPHKSSEINRCSSTCIPCCWAKQVIFLSKSISPCCRPLSKHPTQPCPTKLASLSLS
jgi:hypothetical protein